MSICKSQPFISHGKEVNSIKDVINFLHQIEDSKSASARRAGQLGKIQMQEMKTENSISMVIGNELPCAHLEYKKPVSISHNATHKTQKLGGGERAGGRKQ